MSASSYAARIELTQGAEDNGLATMVASLIRQNLEDNPRKRADFAKLRGRVAVVAEDVLVAMTLDFQGDKLVVHHGIVGMPDVTVRAQSDDIVQLSLVELTGRFALPNLRGEQMRQVVQKSRAGSIQVYGALAHPGLMLRLTRLMSVN
jgi:SCP-2 sterol transfer family